MKRSPWNNHSYQAKRMKKIIDSQVNTLMGLIEEALSKGTVVQESDKVAKCVIYQDDMYRVRQTVQTDAGGELHPVGRGQIDCVGDGDNDYMKFCFDTHSRLSSYFNFQWGRSKGEVHFEAGHPMGAAEIIEAIDRRFVKRCHLFTAKTIGTFLALAACIGGENVQASQRCPITHQGTGVSYEKGAHTR